MEDVTKICTRCGEIKPLADFYTHRSVGREGKPYSACKACERGKQKRLRREHPERLDSYCAAWRAKHPEKVREFKRQDYHRHKDVRKREVRAYQETHREQVRSWKRTYAHTERGRMAHRLKEGKRRAVKLGGTLPDPAPAWVVERMLDIFGRHCVWCGGPFEHIDHIFSLHQEGGSAHRSDNLAPSCGECNGRKHAMDPREWAAKCGRSFEDILTKARQVAAN